MHRDALTETVLVDKHLIKWTLGYPFVVKPLDEDVGPTWNRRPVTSMFTIIATVKLPPPFPSSVRGFCVDSLNQLSLELGMKSAQ
jgi:hypothetical protein